MQREHESTRALVREEAKIFEGNIKVFDLQEGLEEIQSAEIPREEDATEHTHVKSSLSSGLSLTTAAPPQKLQRISKVDSKKEVVASKTEKIQKDEAPESSLLVNQKERGFSSVQAGVQPEISVISLEQIGSTSMTLLSPTTAFSPQDQKTKSRDDTSMTTSGTMYHEDSFFMERSTQPSTDVGVHEEAVSTQRFPGSERSGAPFKVPAGVSPQTFLPDEGHQSRKPPSRVSGRAGAPGDQENAEKTDLHKGIWFS